MQPLALLQRRRPQKPRGEPSSPSVYHTPRAGAGKLALTPTHSAVPRGQTALFADSWVDILSVQLEKKLLDPDTISHTPGLSTPGYLIIGNQ